MTAYHPIYQLEPTQIFSYTSDTAYSYETAEHAVNHAEQQHMPECPPHNPSSSPLSAQDPTYFPSDSSYRIRDDKADSYGCHYYYGRLWDSNIMGGYEKPSSLWTTTSSSNWTALAQDPQLSSPFLSNVQIQTDVLPLNQFAPAFDVQFSGQGGVHPASEIAMDVERSFGSGPSISSLPRSDEIDSSSYGAPLFRLPPSPRFIQSVKMNPSLAAHQTVPPEKISTYSELFPNIEFMERLRLEESYNPIRSPTPPAVAPAVPHNSINTTPNQGPLPDATAEASTDTGKAKSSKNTNATRPPSGSKSRASTSTSTDSTTPPKKRRRRKTVVNEIRGSSSAASAEEMSAFSKGESRKPSLACTFCRERKISCGRPPVGSEDNTCNQCARRSFVCVYLPEASTRGRSRQS